MGSSGMVTSLPIAIYWPGIVIADSPCGRLVKLIRKSIWRIESRLARRIINRFRQHLVRKRCCLYDWQNQEFLFLVPGSGPVRVGLGVITGSHQQYNVSRVKRDAFMYDYYVLHASLVLPHFEGVSLDGCGRFTRVVPSQLLCVKVGWGVFLISFLRSGVVIVSPLEGCPNG